jgi:hypothetical protein
MVNSNRAPEDAEMADRIDALGSPQVLTLDMLKEGEHDDFTAWLCDRKHSRQISHRLEACGYEAVRNPDAENGLWRVSGKRQAVYGSASYRYGRSWRLSQGCGQAGHDTRDTRSLLKPNSMSTA